MKFRLSACLTAMMALACAGGASAETIAVNADNTWHAFDVDELLSASGGLDWISIEDGSTLSFTFTTVTDTLLTIVDAGFAGDRFNVFNNGVLLGQTSVPVQTASSVGLNFDAALATGNYSFATYLLSAGTHTITGTLSQSWLDEYGMPLNATVGALRVSPVPLPGALLLLL
ncbi:MAG TPA: hypothetical protein VNR40_17890, partial [Steroidobacter sp.]|nr:hypothetical protein [Steroidobacter sp.]